MFERRPAHYYAPETIKRYIHCYNEKVGQGYLYTE